MVQQHAIKLTLVVILGLFALGLGTIVLTLQMMVFNMKRLERRKTAAEGSKEAMDVGQKEKQIVSTNNAHETIVRSTPTYRGDLWLWKERDLEKGKPLSAKAYWDQVVQSDLSRWDATIGQQDLSYPDSETQAHVLHALKQAADLGHGDAQHYYAFALSTGAWPVTTTGLGGNETSLFVPDDFLDFPADKEHLLQEAWLNWHMSAMDGNVEAAAALGYRLLQREGQNKEGCEAALPYYEAAAHGIVDQLEAHIHSRAKVVPPQDLHSLPEMHMHGGTSSQLSTNSKPHESPEAIQYLRLRASHPTDPDIHAAHQLAQLHHYGLRGVEPNLTEALQYYEAAAEKNLWEAAGQAGKFHVWGLGMDDPKHRKLLKAHRLFKKGTPGGLTGCRARFKEAKKRQTQQGNIITITSGTHVCDHPCVNGMGLLYLMGVPMVVPRDVSTAQQWFQLGRDMGNMDAAYNLAMVKLGWKTSWKDIDDESITTQKNGISVDEGTIPPFMMEGSMSFKYRHVQHTNQPSASDYITALSDFTSSANKGHLQAHHMLGQLYSNGVLHPTQPNSKPFVKRDCPKALQHFSWIVEEASLPLSRRTTAAYNQYMNGDNEGSLRNYWMAAETGHAISQVNAAFLLDRGTCLSMSQENCRRASLRLWKAAAAQGHVEAALKVGDYYYHKSPYTTPPLWWKWILFPEREVVALWKRAMGSGGDTDPEETKVAAKEDARDAESTETACVVDDGTCSIDEGPTPERRVPDDDPNLSRAAHYYRLASVQHKSPRAHFNLGFLYEWGLGLKQDFPLAKRHYDLARSSASDETSSDEATDVAVSVALWCMKMHEQAVKLSVSYNEWRDNRKAPKPDNSKDIAETAESEEEVLDPEETTEIDIILKHVLSWESLLIIVLTYLLSIIFSYRVTQRRRQ